MRAKRYFNIYRTNNNIKYFNKIRKKHLDLSNSLLKTQKKSFIYFID